MNDEPMRASLALRVARAVSLADALDAATVDDPVLDQAGRLLLALATPDDYRVRLAAYRDARRVYRALARRLTGAPPSMERYALVTSLFDELRTGNAACLDWEPGERTDLAGALCVALQQRDWTDHLAAARSSPDPIARRRADWAQHRAADAAHAPASPPPFRIEIVPSDPCRNTGVQTRILVDGRPIVAAVFDRGPPFPPEVLCARGRLRADVEPREVRLAEAYCTEGCCGALYVTIARDGDAVVWRDWRGHTCRTAPPELRFDAAGYDAEIARAEGTVTGTGDAVR